MAPGPSRLHSTSPIEGHSNQEKILHPPQPGVGGGQLNTDSNSMGGSASGPGPSQLATTEVELAGQIWKILEDMIWEQVTGEPNIATSPKPSHSSQMDIDTGDHSSTGGVTMRRLPENIDQAIADFLLHVLGKPQGGANEDGDDVHSDQNDDTFQDTHSETESNHDNSEDEDFYTAANNSTANLSTTIPLGSTTPPNQEMEVDNSLWGTRLCPCLTTLDKLHQQKMCSGEVPAWPFTDYLEFEFVKWMVDNDISQTACDKLIKLPIIAERCGLSFARTIPNSSKPGAFLTEEVEIWVQDIIEVVCELIGNTAYGQKLVFAPCWIYLNGDENQQKIDEMWTADWWLRIQETLPAGATLVPIILSSDATQLTNFSGGKVAWPVYISIGNIPKAICAKINSYSTPLLAYLPVPKLDCFPEKERGDQKARIFHECMSLILEPLHEAGTHGVEMDCGDGFVRHCFPVLAAYIADNPEQTMIACCHCNLCYQCIVNQDKQGDLPDSPPGPCNPCHTANALIAHDLGHISCLFEQQGLKPFRKPFWAGLPHTDIFTCLTPDLLHQLHKGVFKDHLMSWCTDLIKKTSGSIDDVDNHYKLMPCHSGLRHFTSGVTKLKQSTANEHREMQKVFIAVMAGLVPDDVLPVIVAAIDFIYYAQLPTHTTATLDLLDNALQQFHAHKEVFIKYEIRTDFNINKIHSMSHYFEAIWELGTADGYNTETPEHLHIEFAKHAYKATNWVKFFEQMTAYIQCQEKVAKFDAYLCMVIPAYAAWDTAFEKDLQEEPGAPGWRLAKESPLPPVPIALLPEAYAIHWFSWCMETCIEKYFPDVQPNVPETETILVYPKATQLINDAFVSQQSDIVHASPAVQAIL
ncbi:hypothetical protein CTheo_8281 [Ceratobasidium theobromae]|uniref:Uncharacterized protein n=1 Tax=Ceratobasidium theobromae TaxID=1582974 RepID=A0A5N5QA41_9AGAM|nr:hypothetical protein CTheo_8281 [Ceratobasidium theobromae]